MLITDQVATAPCSDPIQERFRTFEAKRLANKDETHEMVWSKYPL